MVRGLAVGIGPREATSSAYAEAADLVERALADAGGYRIRRQRFRVPDGVSWGVDVPAGRTTNLVALPTATQHPSAFLVGAHLDTVPQAPGAEDNASGIAVLLELARMSAGRHPVILVAFGAEEPRGDADDEHHYGSRTFVRRPIGVRVRPDRSGGPDRDDADLAVLRGMVSLDRVGAGDSVRIRTGGRAPGSVAHQLRAAAAELDIPTADGEDHTASDHWSFEKAGVPAARIGGHAFAGYHNAKDLPDQVRDVQLRRTARLIWRWTVQRTVSVD